MSDPPPCSPGIFRLLVPAATTLTAGERTVNLGGRPWVVRSFDRVPTKENAPAYACVSYAWGAARTPDPLATGQTISARAIPAAETAIEALKPEALWLDAFCVPNEQPARRECLRNMGAIYAAAAEVVCVLSPACAPLVQELHKRTIDPIALLSLETDDWVSRVWTYQEMANSRKLLFVAEGTGGPAVGGDNFFSDLMGAIETVRKAEGLDAFEMRARHPRLDSFEELIGDWYMGGYLERTGFQAVSAMDRRTAERPDDYFEALLGVIGAAQHDAPGIGPAEQFMRLCEMKGDFSFVYCVAPRSTEAGRCWRPLPGRLSAVLSWHSYGDGQPGVLAASHLDLHNVSLMRRGTISAQARTHIEEWWRGGRPELPPPADLAAAALVLLRKAGFTGTGGCIELEGGYFFPQTLAANTDLVAVATGVQWAHGAPGLLLEGGDSLMHLRDVGVFVGPVPERGATISLGT
jgi:hypothetical protein